MACLEKYGKLVRVSDAVRTCSRKLGIYKCECVDQGNYGHRAQKGTWLYANGCTLPELIWGKAPRPAGVDSTSARSIKTGICQRLSKNQRTATPPAFRDLLISIALTAEPS